MGPMWARHSFINLCIKLTCGSHGVYYFSGSNCHVSATSVPCQIETESN